MVWFCQGFDYWIKGCCGLEIGGGDSDFGAIEDNEDKLKRGNGIFLKLGCSVWG
jgi:hypothetical protein